MTTSKLLVVKSTLGARCSWQSTKCTCKDHSHRSNNATNFLGFPCLWHAIAVWTGWKTRIKSCTSLLQCSGWGRGALQRRLLSLGLQIWVSMIAGFMCSLGKGESCPQQDPKTIGIFRGFGLECECLFPPLKQDSVQVHWHHTGKSASNGPGPHMTTELRLRQRLASSEEHCCLGSNQVSFDILGQHGKSFPLGPHQGNFGIVCKTWHFGQMIFVVFWTKSF